jgi:hypothetical protein
MSQITENKRFLHSGSAHIVRAQGGSNFLWRFGKRECRAWAQITNWVPVHGNKRGLQSLSHACIQYLLLASGIWMYHPVMVLSCSLRLSGQPQVNLPYTKTAQLVAVDLWRPAQGLLGAFPFVLFHSIWAASAALSSCLLGPCSPHASALCTSTWKVWPGRELVTRVSLQVWPFSWGQSCACFLKVSSRWIPFFISFKKLFLLAYKGVYCDDSIGAYSLLWTSSPPLLYSLLSPLFPFTIILCGFHYV